MKYFALALIASVAASAAIDANEIQIFDQEDIVYNGTTVGAVSAYTSWISSGSGADAAIIPYFYVDVIQDPSFTAGDALTGANVKWQMCFAADDSTANTEIGTIGFGGGSPNLVTYTYGLWAQTIGDSQGQDETTGSTDSGVYRLIIDDGGATFTAQQGSVPPGSAYWTPNCNDSADLCYNSGALADGDIEFGIGFKRTNAGVAGIAAGSTVSGSFMMSLSGSETFYQAGQMEWTAAPVVDDSNDDDDDDSTDNSTDTTGDDDTSGDDDSQDDGASVLTYGAALAASVYALAF